METMETKGVKKGLFVSMFLPVLEKPRFHRLQSKKGFVSVRFRFVSIFVSRFLGIGGKRGNEGRKGAFLDGFLRILVEGPQTSA